MEASKKFGRNYLLTVQDLITANVIEIKPPFTIDFTITRNFFGSPNTAQIRIYNLNEKTRAFIRKDQNDFGWLKSVGLFAGYGEKLSAMTYGNINSAWSVRENTSYVTTIESFDGGVAFLNSSFSGQFVAGTTTETIIRTLAKSLEQYDLKIGAISNTFNQPIKRGNSYSGNATNLLREITGGGFFIDNGVINCLADNEFIFGKVPVISAETGLQGTPRREWTNVEFDMLFEPELYIGQKIILQGEADKSFDGDYVIRALSHSGTISDSVGGTAITKVVCTKCDAFFTAIRGANVG